MINRSSIELSAMILHFFQSRLKIREQRIILFFRSRSMSLLFFLSFSFFFPCIVLHLACNCAVLKRGREEWIPETQRRGIRIAPLSRLLTNTTGVSRKISISAKDPIKRHFSCISFLLARSTTMIPTQFIDCNGDQIIFHGRQISAAIIDRRAGFEREVGASYRPRPIARRRQTYCPIV